MSAPAFLAPGGRVRRVGAWLAPALTDPLRLRIVERAGVDVLLLETPRGSNRGTRIDEYNRAAGVPESLILAGKAYYCGSTLAAWWRESGAETPGKYRDPSCDEWVKFAIRTGTWHPKGSYRPQVGDAVVYGKASPQGPVQLPDGRRVDAVHIGAVVRTDEGLWAMEGNTSGGLFSRDGIGMFPKEVDLSRVLGFIEPRPA